MNTGNRKPVGAALTAGVVLVVILGGGLIWRLQAAENELRREREGRLSAETARETAENEASGLRAQVVLLKAELDQQSALLSGQASPQQLRRLEQELEAARLHASLLETRLAPDPATDPDPDTTPGDEPFGEPDAPEGDPRRDRRREPDPERAEEMRRQRDDFVGRARGLLGDRLHNYAERAGSVQNREEAEVAGRIAATLQQMDALLAQSAEEMNWDQRRRNFGAMREHWEALGPLMDRDRDLRLQGLAREMGYRNRAEAEQFVDYVRQIYDDTSFDPRQMMGGGGPGRGRR